MTVKGLFDSAQSAARTFRTFQEGKPELIATGIPELDEEIGGVTPGTLVVVAADTGVGKSRLALGAALSYAETATKGRHGIISLEDPEDVVGCRLLGWAAGVDSRKIRTKDFTRREAEKLEEGLVRLRQIDERGTGPAFAYAVGGGLDDIEGAIAELAAIGCTFAWLDYLQKVDGVSDDRRTEVGRVMRGTQRAAARCGMATGILSQFARRDQAKEPQLYHLKESGDIENECRVAVLGWTAQMGTEDVVAFRIAKSTYGGAGKRFMRRNDNSGMLVPWIPDEEDTF